jgi:IS5 family transposase
MPSSSANNFLEWFDRALERKLIEKHAIYPATLGRPPCPPLTLFKVSLFQHCYGLSAPQYEELVIECVSWRRFANLGLQDKMPDKTTLVRFRQQLIEHGLHEKMLALVNRKLEQKGFILKTCTLVDATLIRHVTLTATNIHDRREFENVVKGDKAYWSAERSRWCARRKIDNGINNTFAEVFKYET